MVNYMSSPHVRLYLIGLWMAVGAMVFIGVGSWTERSWSLLFVAATIPPAMMLWFWNEDRPLNMERLRRATEDTPVSPSGR